MMEAGVNSVRKREQQCDEREQMCNDSLDGKPKPGIKRRKIIIK